MHELSIALSVLDIVRTAAAGAGLSSVGVVRHCHANARSFASSVTMRRRMIRSPSAIWRMSVLSVTYADVAPRWMIPLAEEAWRP